MQEENKPAKFLRMPVVLLLFLVLITYFYFVPLWFLLQRKSVNRLNSDRKMAVLPFVLVILFCISAFVFAIISMVPGVSDLASVVALGGSYLLQWFAVIVLMDQSFKFKNIIIDHFKNAYSADYPVSRMMVFLFGTAYLQYKINRLPEDIR